MKKKFVFPADISVLESIGRIVTVAGENFGCNELEVGELMLALDEACTNTITHGLENKTLESFELEIEHDEKQIVFSIYEKGKAFDYLNIKTPDVNAQLEERDIGGLGIYFVQQLMDEVEYKVDDNGLKTLRMVKNKKKPEAS